MGQQKITIVERKDLGPVLARADHQENAIEVNGKAFYALPPMVQEFVLCHEVCHLQHNEWNEARTNRLASELFIRRSKSADDRMERERFLSYLDGTDGQYSNWWQAVIAAIPAMFNLGTTIYGVVKNQNAGWYSWDDTSKRANLDTMLKQAFEQSRKSGSQSAAEYFWAQMQIYTNKDDSLDQFMNRSGNAIVGQYVKKYEKAYGFGFKEVTPIDITAYPLAIVAIGGLIAFIVYKIIKKYKK